jgi:hypothetical protein
MSMLQDLHRAHLERRRRFDAAVPKPQPAAAPVVVAPPPLPPTPEYRPRWRWLSHRWVSPDCQEAVKAPELPEARTTIADVTAAVCRYYGISEIEIKSKRRTKVVAHQRQVAMYLAKELTLKSLPEIGRRFGGRDHTTILHGVRRITGLLPHNPKLAAEIDEIKAVVGT